MDQALQRFRVGQYLGWRDTQETLYSGTEIPVFGGLAGSEHHLIDFTG